MFHNIASLYQGGSIYYSCPFSSFIISHSCGNECRTTDSSDQEGQFAYILVDSKKKLETYFLSLTLCAQNHNKPRFRSYILDNGYQYVSNFNSSLNYANRQPGIRSVYSTNYKGIFCNFYKNKADWWVCIALLHNQGNFSFCNIIENNSPLDNGVVFTNVDGQLFFTNCIFKNNLNCLFFALSGNINIENSNIKHDYLLYSYNVNLFKINYFIIHTMVISQFSSYFCPTNFINSFKLNKINYFHKKLTYILSLSILNN